MEPPQLAAAELPDLLARLDDCAEHARSRPRAERIRQLGTAVDALLDTSGTFASLVAAEAGADPETEEMIRVSLRRTLRAWRAPALTRVLSEAESAPGRHVAPRRLVIVLAQNTPGLAIPPILQGLALGSAVLVKTASGARAGAATFAALLAELAPGLGDAVAVRHWHGGDATIEDLVAREADRLLVHGDTGAIRAWRERAGRKVVERGPRVSLALVGSSPDDAEVRGLAEDIALLDGHGCLSPQVILTTPDADLPRLAHALGEALAEVGKQWPRHRLQDSEAGEFRAAVDEAELASAGDPARFFHGGHEAGFGVEVACTSRLQAAPLNRFIRLHRQENAAELRTTLQPLGATLECVGLGGRVPATWVDTLVAAGARRLCAVGSMQDPPADWQSPAPLFLTSHDERPERERDLPGRFRGAVAQTSDAPRALDVVRAAGTRVHTRDGASHLDLLSGIGVMGIGHAHPRVATAVARQARAYTHVMVYGEDALAPQVELAEQLAARLPGNLSRTYFTNSGTEAVEGALKLVRKATGRTRVLSFEGAFHGDTTGAVALGGNPLYREPFRPLLEDVTQIPWDEETALGEIDSTTAAVFAEPVQAEAGVRIPSARFLGRLRDRCDETGTLLVFDEVVTGFGRTGRFWGFEHWPEAVPDVLLLAKSLGGGLPLGAFIASPELMQALATDPPLGHVTTFGGNPVCCAAALAALEVIEQEGLVERGAATGLRLLERLRGMEGRGGLVEVRGLGMLFGLEFASAAQCARFADNCRARRLLLGWTLHEDRVIRLAPPLILSREDEDQAIAAMRSALADS